MRANASESRPLVDLKAMFLPWAGAFLTAEVRHLNRIQRVQIWSRRDWENLIPIPVLPCLNRNIVTRREAEGGTNCLVPFAVPQA